MPGLLPLFHVYPHQARGDTNHPADSSRSAVSAPGLPKGHLVMGYDGQGRCPMLIDGECSIYEHRPQTCRDYDCRIFAAAGIAPGERTQPEIARRVNEWAFSYETEESRGEQSILRKAAAFLQSNRDLFPPGTVPGNPGQLAAFAVRIYRLFAEITAGTHGHLSAQPDAAMVRAIVAALSENAPSRPAKPD
jgi:Fe-S-cluster containining protein